MNKKSTLAELMVGESAVVSSIDSGNYIRLRLRDLGLINGTTVECVMKSPLGDPAAYLIRGAVIALRNEDSCAVRLC